MANIDIGTVYPPSIKKGYLRGSRTAMANKNAKVLLLGDSNLAGAGAGSSGNFNYIGAMANGIGAQLSALSPDYNGVLNHYVGMQNVVTNPNFVQYDPRFAFSGTLTDGAPFNAGNIGANTFCVGTSGTIATFTPAQPFDTFEIGFISSTNNAVVNVKIGGNVITTLNGNQATAIRTTGPISAPAGSTGMVLDTASGSASTPIAWIRTWNAAAPGIQLLQGAWSGGTIGNVIATTNPYSSGNQIAAMAPDLVLVNGLTLNDSSAGTATATWQSGFDTLVGQARSAGADIAWATSINVEGDASASANATLNRLLRAKCAEHNVPLLELELAWRPKTPYVGNYYDARHPSYAGATIIANAFHNFMNTLRWG